MSKVNAYIHFWLTALLVFIMPIWQKPAAGLITLLLINWVIARFTRGFPPRNQLAFTLLMIAFYAWHAIGLLWTENMDAGTFDLEVKLSFVALPIIFGFTTPFPPKVVKQLLEIFVGGVAMANLICLIDSAYLYFTESPGAFQFYGPYYSKLMHLGYFALYINFAIVAIIALFTYFGDSYRKWLRYLLIFLLLWFAFAVIQTSSKNGILTLFLLIPVVGGYFVITRKKYKLGILGLALAFGAVVMVLVASPRTFYRFEMMWEAMGESEYDPTSTESTAVRAFAWDAATDLVLEEPLTGHGTGDVKEVLLDKYAEKGYTGALEKKVNAHSQFLQTAVGLGIPGLLLLVSLFFGFLKIAWSQQKRLLALFLFMMAIFAATESVLERGAGVVFFSLWTCILVYSFPRLGKRDERKA